MKRRAQQIELPGLPLAPMRLKEIPLENGNGQRLRVCERCHGDGEICTATKEHETPAGSKRIETTTIRKSAVKAHVRGLWKVASEICIACSGAGMVKVAS